MLVQNRLQFVVGRLLFLLNDVSKVKWIFPEDKNKDNFEDERNIGDKFDKSAQLVLITAIFLIFFWSASIDHEQLDEVVDQTDCDE